MSKIKCKDHLGNIFKSEKEMCDFWGISDTTFTKRIKAGWSLEEALTTKSKRHKYKDHLGQEFNSMREMCRHWKIPYGRFFARIKTGWSVKDALTTKEVSESQQCKDHLGNIFKSEKEMCKQYGIPVTTFRNRILLGMTVKDALLAGPDNMNSKKCKDHLGQEFGSIKEMCNQYGISISTFNNRIKKGWSLEDALTEKLEDNSITDPYGKTFVSVRQMCIYHNKNYDSINRRLTAGWSIYETFEVIPRITWRTKDVAINDNLKVISPIKSDYSNAVAYNCDYCGEFKILTYNEIIQLYERDVLHKDNI